MNVTVDFLVGQHLAYQFLSKAFYEQPDADFIQMLVDNHLFDDWMIDSEQVDMRAGLGLLRAYCQSWDKEQFQALKRDYMHLFIGPEHVLVPFWESVYLSPDHILYERQTLEVRQQYRRFGMALPENNIEPDDHLGLELLFVAYLFRLALAAVEQEQQESLNTILAGIRSFFDAHLLLWAGDCLQGIIQHAETPFLQGIAHLTLGCLAHTSEALQVETVR